MKIQLICGFLGAGKTTLLKQILQQETSNTAVLVNEFGELGIDGKLIADGNNFNVVEMPSGCICCSLKASLIEAVQEIMEKYNPQQLLIEPSGIAAPSSIIEGLKNAPFWSSIEWSPVIGIIDMTFFIELVRQDDYNNFFLDQIANSDIILLNKADQVTDAEQELCKKAVSAHNPIAIVIPTLYCQTELPKVQARGEAKHFHFSNQFEAKSFTTSGTVGQNIIEKLLASLINGEFGQIFRAKGIFKTVNGPVTFDYVNGISEYGSITDMDENKFVFIGRAIDQTKLEAFVRGGNTDGP